MRQRSSTCLEPISSANAPPCGAARSSSSSEKRDQLQLGQLIPVGDLWDVVASRDEPFSHELKALFETAKRLWRTKLRPALAAMNNVADTTPPDAPERRVLAADERLVKSILLAALVPEIEAFRGLDARRLVALNWGSVTSPIAGNETQLVAGKLTRLSTQVPELLVSDDPVNPSVTIRLADVDTDDIISRAATSYDTLGGRRQKIRTLIAEALGDRIGSDLRGTFDHDWRGTRRPVDVIFGNVRDPNDLADAALVASPDQPKLVIDFPFDDQHRSPEDDLERLDDWSQRHPPSTTVCWLPSFFNQQGLVALGRYVAVDELLKLDRFEAHTSHLSANQRAEAKPILTSLRNTLAAQLHEAIKNAYGVIRSGSPFVEQAGALTDHLRCLDPALVVRPTTRPTLDEALSELCDQVFDNLYPGHPRFESRVTRAQLRNTWAELQRALADPDGRITVESTHRKTMSNVANAMQLGTMHESHFLLGEFWRGQLDRRLADAGDQGVTVDQVRAWIDEVDGGPRGLAPEIADLAVLTLAAQTDHRVSHRGTTYAADAGTPMPGDVQLVPEVLPSEQAWTRAVDRAARVFGKTFRQRVTGPELAALGSQVRARADELKGDAVRLADALSRTYTEWGIGAGDRMATATAARDLVTDLSQADDNRVVELLAEFEPPTSEEAAAKSLTSAAQVAACLGRANLSLWKTARSAVEADATKALMSDEIALALEPAEQAIEVAATAYVASTRVAAPPPSPARSFGGSAPPAASASPVDVAPVEPTPFAATAAGERRTVVRTSSDIEELAAELRDALATSDAIEVRWTPGGGR